MGQKWDTKMGRRVEVLDMSTCKFGTQKWDIEMGHRVEVLEMSTCKFGTQKWAQKWDIEMEHSNETKQWDIEMGKRTGIWKWDIEMGHRNRKCKHKRAKGSGTFTRAFTVPQPRIRVILFQINVKLS